MLHGLNVLCEQAETISALKKGSTTFPSRTSRRLSLSATPAAARSCAGVQILDLGEDAQWNEVEVQTQIRLHKTSGPGRLQKSY
jgi:hypothetical protein